MFADKTETLELYISILGLDKRYERTLTTLELHEELALTGTVSVGRRIEEGIGRERRKRWFCSLPPLSSIVRPKGGERI